MHAEGIGTEPGGFCVNASARAGVGQALLRGEVELAIGVLEGDPAYQFEDIGALAMDPGGRIYVADSGPPDVRVYDSDGRYLYRITGPGEGPGELRYKRLCRLAFNPSGQLWLKHLLFYEVFVVGESSAEHLQTMDLAGHSVGCGYPMFIGPTGLTFRQAYANAEAYLHVTPDGEYVARTVGFGGPERGFGPWEWPSARLTHPDRHEVIEYDLKPPYAAEFLSADAPTGDFARAFSPFYRIEIYHPDGTLRHELQREVVGPLITAAEKRNAENELRSEVDRAQPLILVLAKYPIPDRKPVIRHIW